MDTHLGGMVIVCLSGLAGGLFAFPLRMNRVWAEENTLLGAFVLAVAVIPLVVASILFPAWPAVIGRAETRDLLIPLLCGMGWGVGAISYARGVSRIGVGLTVSTVMSLTIAIGAVTPLAIRWTAVESSAKAWVLVGVAVCVAGIALFGAAGRLREKSGASGSRRSYLTGFLWCLVSGALSPLANIGFDTGGKLGDLAAGLGADPLMAAMLCWFPTWAGGLGVLILVLGGRMLRSGTWRRWIAPGFGRDLGRTAAMGALHWLGQVPYGVGAAMLGLLGTSAGWAATLAAQLLSANGMGLVLGEWRGSPRAARGLLAAGMAVVLAAVGLLAWASRRAV